MTSSTSSVGHSTAIFLTIALLWFGFISVETWEWVASEIIPTFFTTRTIIDSPGVLITVDDTVMMWGLKYYSVMLLQAGAGNVLSDLLFGKDRATFSFDQGWAFPRHIYFNGDDCFVLPPNAYPRLPNSSPYPNVVEIRNLVFLSVAERIKELEDGELRQRYSDINGMGGVKSVADVFWSGMSCILSFRDPIFGY